VSHTVRNKVKGVKFHAPSITAALQRMGLTLNVDFFVSEKADHSIVNWRRVKKTNEPPVQIWIAKHAVCKAAGTNNSASNEVGFRADKNGNLEIVNNEYDSENNFTPPVIKKFTDFVKVEGTKIVARKKGHTKFVEKMVKGKLKLFVQ